MSLGKDESKRNLLKERLNKDSRIRGELVDVNRTDTGESSAGAGEGVVFYRQRTTTSDVSDIRHYVSVQCVCTKLIP